VWRPPWRSAVVTSTADGKEREREGGSSSLPLWATPVPYERASERGSRVLAITKAGDDDCAINDDLYPLPPTYLHSFVVLLA